LRISGNCLASIVDDDGRYALLVNKGWLTHNGRKALSPVGGAFELESQGYRYLVTLGAQNFEKGNDLRCRVPDNKVKKVVRWFRRRTGRETSVLRELTEELTDETGILTRSGLAGITQEYSGYTRYDALTTRDVPEKQTAYLLEIFNVTVRREIMRKLHVAAEVPSKQRLLYFVTREELLAGVARDGTPIGPIARVALLEAKKK
jgi:hypothetical protein